MYPQNVSIEGKILPLPTVIDSKMLYSVIIRINERYASFIRRVSANGIFMSHALYDVKANPMDVYFLPYCLQCRGALDGCYVCVSAGKPGGKSRKGESRSGNASARN